MKYIQVLNCVLLLMLTQRSIAAVGGHQVWENEPISSSLVNIKMRHGMCSGTLISPNVVITAAHCRDRLGPAEFVAKIGVDSTDPCDVSEVVDAAFIPNAKTNLPFRVHNPDLFMIRIRTPLCHASPATLSNSQISIGDRVYATGHGQGSLVFGSPNKIELILVDFATAISSVFPLSDLHRELLVMGRNSFQFAFPIDSLSSLCEGDSGGPVFREVGGVAHLLGVNSAVLPNETLGAPSCDRAYLQVFTPIAPYISAIRTVVARFSSTKL